MEGPFTIPAQTFNDLSIPELVFYKIPCDVIMNTRTQQLVYSDLVDATSSTDEIYVCYFSNTSYVLSRTIFAAKVSGAKIFRTSTLELNSFWQYDDKTAYRNAITSSLSRSQYTALVSTNNDSNSYGQAAWMNAIAWLMAYGGYDGAQITYNLTNCTGSFDNPTMIYPGDEEEVVFTADTGYTFQDAPGEYSVTGGYIVGTVLVTDTTLSFTVALSEGSRGITITVAVGQKIRVRYVLNACHLGPQSVGTNPEFVERGELYDFNFIANEGYRFHSKQQDIATNDGIVLFDPRNRLPDTYCLIYGRVSSDAETVVISVNLAGDPYEGLDGEEDPESETVTPPGLPTTTAVSAGIIGLFVPNLSQMRDLADFMWTNFGGIGTTTDEILAEIVEALKRSISNPLDYIFGLNIIPSNGLSTGTPKTVRFGYMSSGVSMPTLTNQFFEVDCGSVYFEYEYGGTFLDFAPYSKISLYLPYIGFRDVDANDFIGHTISIKYRCDAVSGACVAFISKDGSVMYQYSGNCACTLPLNSDSWARTIGAVVQAGSAIAGATAVGGAMGGKEAAEAGMKASAITNAASIAGNSSLIAPKVNRVGSLAGSAGLLGVQYPFVVREAPRFHSTDGFNTIAGYPSWYFLSLGSLVGFTKVVNVHLHNINALRDELDEIETLLRGGVIL